MGEATQGHARGSRVTIAGRRGQRLALADRLPMYSLIAHEFGHVLGLHGPGSISIFAVDELGLASAPVSREVDHGAQADA